MESLLAQYREAAVEHGKCTYAGARPRITNAVGKKLQAIFKAMVAAHEDHFLLELYDYKDLWVQIWAAGHTLEIAEEQAIAKLKELATLRYGLTRTTAHYALAEWQAGNLKFRPIQTP